MKKLLAIILVLLVASFMVACNSDAGQTTETAETATKAEESAAAEEATQEATEQEASEEVDYSDITIAYACSSLTNEIFAMQVEAMQAYCDEIGVNFLYKPSEDNEGKLNAIENYKSMDVDVIIVHVSDPATFEGVMKEVQAAGIKFFSYDTNIEGADAYYGWDNYDLGYAIGTNAAEWVNATFDPSETVNAASANYPELEFLKTREQGYVDALAELAPNVEFVTEGLGGLASYGVTSGENFLQMGVDINLVVGINDGGCLGVYEAFKAANYGDDKVGIFGCDATNDAINAIASGGIYRGTVTTELINVAPEFIDICIEMATGGEGGDHWGPTTPINAANIDEFMN